MIRRLVLIVAVLVGAAAAGWTFLVRRTGDPRMAWDAVELSDVRREDGSLCGTIGITNRGTALGVVRRVEGRVVSGGGGRVLATRQGSRPPEPGWWVSNLLDPGESCVAEVTVELASEPTGTVEVELTIQELGPRLFQYRTARVRVSLPVAA